MKRWTKYAAKYKKFFILGPLCMVGEILGEIFMPMMFAQIINYVDPQKTAGQNVGVVLGWSAAMIALALFMMATGVGGAYFGARAATNYATDLRADVYKKIQSFSFANIDRFSTGSLVTRLTNDITQIMNFVNMLLRMCLRAPGMLIGGIIMAFYIGSKSNVIQVPIIIVSAVVVMAVSELILISIGSKRFNKMQKNIDAVNNYVGEDITNIRVVKSFVREDYERGRFDGKNKNLQSSMLSALRLIIFMQPIMMIVMNLTVLGVTYFGGIHIISGDMEPGYFSAYLSYIMQILMSMMMLAMVFFNGTRAIASGRRIGQVMDERLDLSDEGAALPDARVSGGDIEFRDVSYRYYKNSEESVLSHINLKIAAGETVGIIGSTGCGKSTLISLIPRLYDADEGAVLVGGINVRDYSLRNLRDGIGMVLQKNTLFSGSIKDNLLWGDEGASEEEIAAFASSAQADGFIRSFADGYEHILGQGGAGVSGGQRQRLCIARALLKKSPIIILDDSTSAVDTATEAKIREAFSGSLRDSTKIIIAQRITSVMDADRIIVMNDGAITGIGTHAELLESNKEYGEIYNTQMESKNGRIQGNNSEDKK